MSDKENVPTPAPKERKPRKPKNPTRNENSTLASSGGYLFDDATQAEPPATPAEEITPTKKVSKKRSIEEAKSSDVVEQPQSWMDTYSSAVMAFQPLYNLIRSFKEEDVKLRAKGKGAKDKILERVYKLKSKYFKQTSRPKDIDQAFSLIWRAFQAFENVWSMEPDDDTAWSNEESIKLYEKLQKVILQHSE